jgi:hypothetical protein
MESSVANPGTVEGCCAAAWTVHPMASAIARIGVLFRIVSRIRGATLI